MESPIVKSLIEKLKKNNSGKGSLVGEYALACVCVNSVLCAQTPGVCASSHDLKSQDMNTMRNGRYSFPKSDGSPVNKAVARTR